MALKCSSYSANVAQISVFQTDFENNLSEICEINSMELQTEYILKVEINFSEIIIQIACILTDCRQAQIEQELNKS